MSDTIEHIRDVKSTKVMPGELRAIIGCSSFVGMVIVEEIESCGLDLSSEVPVAVATKRASWMALFKREEECVED